MSLIDELIADLERLRPKDTQPQQRKEPFVTPVTQKKQCYGNSAPPAIWLQYTMYIHQSSDAQSSQGLP